MPVPRCWRRVQMLRCRCGECGVVCVDIGDLDVDESLRVG